MKPISGVFRITAVRIADPTEMPVRRGEELRHREWVYEHTAEVTENTRIEPHCELLFRCREPIHIDSMVEIAIFDPRTHRVEALTQAGP